MEPHPCAGVQVKFQGASTFFLTFLVPCREKAAVLAWHYRNLEAYRVKCASEKEKIPGKLRRKM